MGEIAVDAVSDLAREGEESGGWFWWRHVGWLGCVGRVFGFLDLFKK